MKRFPLLPLVAVVFAVACTDSTSPANSHALLSAKNPDLGFLGNPPPPPVDAAIGVTIYGTSTLSTGAYLATVSTDLPAVQFPLRGQFTGAYFANGASVEAAAAAIELGDESLSFLGTAWLRFDNTFGTTASANARFKRSDDKLFGMGTLVLNDELGVSHTIRIVAVTSFTASLDCSGDQCVPKSDCSFSGEQCAVIVFDATVDGDPGIHRGTAIASNAEPCRLECDVVAPPPG